MNHLVKTMFALCLCFIAINCKSVTTDGDLTALETPITARIVGKVKDHEERANRTRRQAGLAFAGGTGIGFGAYDYNDYYGDYTSDYAYDYYDWVCSELACQLCDILTGECCTPGPQDPNCVMPDSCINNPCLSGGTCITTRTIDNQADFICVCLPGLTGKYCQLVNDYFIGANILPPLPPVVIAPPPPPPAVEPLPETTTPETTTVPYTYPQYAPPQYPQQAPYAPQMAAAPAPYAPPMAAAPAPYAPPMAAAPAPYAPRVAAAPQYQQYQQAPMQSAQLPAQPEQSADQQGGSGDQQQQQGDQQLQRPVGIKAQTMHQQRFPKN